MHLFSITAAALCWADVINKPECLGYPHSLQISSATTMSSQPGIHLIKDTFRDIIKYVPSGFLWKSTWLSHWGRSFLWHCVKHPWIPLLFVGLLVKANIFNICQHLTLTYTLEHLHIYLGSKFACIIYM